MEEKPIIEAGARFKWQNGHVSEVVELRYVDEDGRVHITTKLNTGIGEDVNRITASDIYEKVEAGDLEPIN
jgi:hypothetical protein